MLKFLEEYKSLYGENAVYKLEMFKNILITKNKEFNLTAITDEIGVEIKHFEDCLKNEKFFTKNANVVEIGSGGGFPSIPLMCARDDLKFTLIESTGKKCEFLKEVIKTLSLKGEVVEGRAEELGQNTNFREKFDIVTARAVARLNILCEYCIPFIKKDGFFIAYKGDDKQEEKESQKAIKTLGGKIIDKQEYELSLEMGKRTVYIIKKEFLTPKEYPRRNSKIRSNPL